MGKGIIVYQSKYGATKKYAEWLREATGFDMAETPKADGRTIEQYDRIILTGVVAECCVLSTAFSCIDEGLEFIYLRDAVSGISNETAMEAEKILSYLTPVHGRIMTTDDYLYL